GENFMKTLLSLSFMFGVFLTTAVFAQEHAAEQVATGYGHQAWLAIAAGFGMSIASAAGVWGQSRALSTALDGIARNPGAQTKIFIPMVVGLALIESLVLLSFIVANGLSGRI
ncbi:MAG: ATP synthase F0 subunit C, partial [Bdellovibrionales bacterium]|nr:ATP synthase F0 subunit C [Bdellovibrionales bacterium]